MKSVFQILLWVSTWALLFTICLGGKNLPPGQTALQALWVGLLGITFTIVYSLCLIFKVHKAFASIISWGLIATGGIQAIWGLLQIYGECSSSHPLFHLTGSFYNPGPYAGYLAFTFPLCFHQMLCLHQLKQRNRIINMQYVITLTICILIATVLPASMSRSAWLATFISGIFIYGMYTGMHERLRKTWRTHKKKFIIIALFSLSVCLVIGIYTLHIKKDSAMGRIFIWKITTEAIVQKPLVGYGPNSFPFVYGNFQEKYFAKEHFSEQEEYVAGSPQYAFNEYLQIALEYGCVALMVIVTIIIYCWIVSFKAKSIGFSGGVLSFCVFACTSYPTQFPGFSIAFLLVLLGCVIEQRRRVILLLTSVIAIYSICSYKNNHYMDCLQWSDSRILYEMQSYAVAEKGYEHIYPALRKNGMFLFEYGRCLNKIKEYEKSIDVLNESILYNCDPMVLNIIGKNYVELKQYTEAEEYFIRSSHRLPNRIYPYYLLAKLYAEPQFRQPEKFKKMADKVLHKKPKVYSKAIEEMREEIKNIAKERHLPI